LWHHGLISHNTPVLVLDVAGAEALILERIQPLTTHRVALSEASGRVLRQNVASDRDQPPFDRVTMDGIAIAYRDWTAGQRHFEIVGVQAAGSPPSTLAKAGQCIEIMTGAVLPRGADTIVPVERITREGNVARVDDSATVVERRFVHGRGSDRPAGEILLGAGSRINAPEIAILASAGLAEVDVAARPRVAVISTGDELVEPGAPTAEHQVRSSNDRAIEAALERHCRGRVTRALLKDQRAQMLDRIRQLHADNDVLILSGGVSMGKFDFVPGVLEELGVELVFHKIEQRPGRPMWFGMSRERKPVFALPGNPVSTLVCVYRYVIPALKRALGETEAPRELVALDEDVRFDADLTYFLPVVLSWSSQAAARAHPRPTNTSGDFVSLANTTGFVELPRGADLYPRNSPVRLFRW
jgi:molybdopterin molybdotransferase